jgi:hypothetical protein
VVTEHQIGSIFWINRDPAAFQRRDRLGKDKGGDFIGADLQVIKPRDQACSYRLMAYFLPPHM